MYLSILLLNSHKACDYVQLSSSPSINIAKISIIEHDKQPPQCSVVINFSQTFM